MIDSIRELLKMLAMVLCIDMAIELALMAGIPHYALIVPLCALIAWRIFDLWRLRKL